MAKIDFDIHYIINYLRKSRQDEEREKRTGEDVLAEQKSLMDRTLSQYDDIIYEQRFEVGSGDKIDTRPVFKKVLEELEAGKWDAVAVKEISRLGRGSYTDMGRIYDLITQRRIYIITPWKIYDPKNPTDLRQIRFELFLSREEFETIRERLVGAKYNYSMQGKWIAGTVPFGYKTDTRQQKLVPDETQADIIRLIFDLYANGLNQNGKVKRMGFRAIGTYLTETLKIPTARGNRIWHPETIRQILNNKAYIGELQFRRTEKVNGKQVARPEEEWIKVEEAHEPIIDLETWEKVQKKFETNKNKPRTPTDFSPSELAGICRCEKCGRRLVRQNSLDKHEKKDGTISRYRKEFLTCLTIGCTFIKYRQIEEALLEFLGELENFSDDELDKYIQQSISIEQKSNFNYEDAIKKLEQKQLDLVRRLDFVFERFEDGTYSKDTFESRKASAEKEILETKAAIESLQGTSHVEENEIKVDTNLIKSKLSSVVELYNSLEDKSDKNELLHRVFNYVGIEQTAKGKRGKPATFNMVVQLRESFLL